METNTERNHNNYQKLKTNKQQNPHNQTTLIWFVSANPIFWNLVIYYVSNCSESMYLHPCINGHHVLFLSMWIYAIKTMLSTGTASQLSERASDSVSLKSERQFAMATKNMLKCLLYETKKENNPCLQILHSRRQMGKRVFLPETIKVKEFSSCLPFRTTPFSGHMCIDFDCWHRNCLHKQ